MKIINAVVSRRIIVLLACLTMAVAAWYEMAQSRAAEATTNLTVLFQMVGDFPLPGGTTRWDYLSLDQDLGRIFIAHLGDSEVVAFDTASKKVVGSIKDIGHVHGTLAIPQKQVVYASATQTDEVVAINPMTLSIIARVPAGVYPDGMAYAPKVGKLYISDENGDTETVINVSRNERVATIPLGGKVGNSQYDSVTQRILVNVQGRQELAIIDPTKDVVVERIALPTKGNHGLLIEAKRRLAFIACEDDNMLLVLDLNTNRVVKRFPLGAEPDVLAYDEKLGKLYVAGEAGVMSVFSVTDSGVAKLGDVLVGPNAHAVAVDPVTHEVYLPLRDVGGVTVMRVLKPRP